MRLRSLKKFPPFLDATSPEEVAELAHHRSPSPPAYEDQPAQAADEAVSISPAEERHFSSEDEGMLEPPSLSFAGKIMIACSPQDFAVLNCCKNAEKAVIHPKKCRPALALTSDAF